MFNTLTVIKIITYLCLHTLFDNYPEYIDEIIWDNNNYRPSFALNYKTPIEYKSQLGFK